MGTGTGTIPVIQSARPSDILIDVEKIRRKEVKEKDGQRKIVAAAVNQSCPTVNN